MQTTKLTSLHILLGMLLFMGALSMPAQAKSSSSGNEQVDRPFADKPPTHTRKAKDTSVPNNTATPQPVATRTPGSQNTSAPVASSTPGSQPTQISTTGAPSSTPGSQPTQIGTAGGPSSTPNGTIAVSTVVTSAFSPTPTALEMSTVAAQQTETVAASFETSTALANAYSPTPTNIGAPTATRTFTPGVPERTATSVALTTSPIAFGRVSASITFIPASPTLSPTAVQVSTGFKQTRTPQIWKKTSWLLGIPVLLILVYAIYREWKNYSLQKG